jgi:hypothetical protein
MATHNVNDTLILSKDVLRGLQRMQEIGSKILGGSKIAYHRDYEEWQQIMEDTHLFWDEIRYKEKLAIAMQKYEALEVTRFDFVNLNNFFESVVKLLEEMQPLLTIADQICNAKYQLDTVSKIFDPIHKKASLIIKEGKL